jgi:two-component system, response regulator
MNKKQKLIEILLVEDNPNDEELTLHALHKNKIINTIHVVHDGEEALDFIFCQGQYSYRSINKPPTVILLDLKLPKVEGLEVLRQIKRDDRTRTIPVVVLTSSQLDRDIVESYRLGVNSFVSKPVAFDEFTRAVSEIGLYWALLNQPVPTEEID